MLHVKEKQEEGGTEEKKTNKQKQKKQKQKKQQQQKQQQQQQQQNRAVIIDVNVNSRTSICKTALYAVRCNCKDQGDDFHGGRFHTTTGPAESLN